MNYAELDNAINNTKKAVAQRFDFRGATAEIELDRKEKKLKLVADDNTKLMGLREMLLSAVIKRGIEPAALRFGEHEATAAGKLKCEVKLTDGLEQETAKTIARAIKDSKIKVQASVQGEEVRVSGKQRDDLQAVMRLLTGGDFGVPLQYVNMREG
jgi:hypothetical protein